MDAGYSGVCFKYLRIGYSRVGHEGCRLLRREVSRVGYSLVGIIISSV